MAAYIIENGGVGICTDFRIWRREKLLKPHRSTVTTSKLMCNNTHKKRYGIDAELQMVVSLRNGELGGLSPVFKKHTSPGNEASRFTQMEEKPFQYTGTGQLLNMTQVRNGK